MGNDSMLVKQDQINHNHKMGEVTASDILILTDNSNPKILQHIIKLLRNFGYTNISANFNPLPQRQIVAKLSFDLIVILEDAISVEQLNYISQLHSYFACPPSVLLLTDDLNPLHKSLSPTDIIFDCCPRPFKYVQFLNRVRLLLQVHHSQLALHHKSNIIESQIIKLQNEGVNKQIQIVQHLSRVSAYRDEVTGNHIKRMSQICAVLGKAVGLSEIKCHLLRHAASMHDIGKIGIPDSILLKEGRLTTDEMLVMKTHTSIGAEILRDESQSEVMIMASEIAATHHEKWDGTGYPFGLVGIDIPLTGRITAIADVFDALTSVRAYKQAWTFMDATKHMAGESGKHFDPDLIPLFLDNVGEITEIIVNHTPLQPIAGTG